MSVDTPYSDWCVVSCLFSHADAFLAENRRPKAMFVYITQSFLFLSVHHAVCLPVVASFE